MGGSAGWRWVMPCSSRGMLRDAEARWKRPEWVAAGEVEERETAWRDCVACSVHASMLRAAADKAGSSCASGLVVGWMAMVTGSPS